MAKRVLRRLSFLATTALVAACSGAVDDGSGNVSTSPSTSPASSPSTGSLTLEWNANTEPDLAGYKIYSATSSGAYGAAIATAAANATSYDATGLQPGVTYFFVITAFDAAGNESARSDEVSAAASL
jgi:fibronectin type 3 domain-containing protein